MSNEVTLLSVAKSEWIKFRSVRSTIVGTIVLVVLTIGLGVLVLFAGARALQHDADHSKGDFRSRLHELGGHHLRRVRRGGHGGSLHLE
jgi:hypothetical protein